MKETDASCSNLIDGKAIAEAVNRETASEVANSMEPSPDSRSSSWATIRRLRFM